jgi:hypothetical protein
MTKYEWAKFRKLILSKHGLNCSLCGFVAPLSRNIFVHEEWAYEVSPDDAVVKLTGFSTVCWDCHQTEHWGLTERMVANGTFHPDTEARLIQHWMKVNNASEAEFVAHKDDAFAEFSSLSGITEWRMDWGPMQTWIDEEFGDADPFEGQPHLF